MRVLVDTSVVIDSLRGNAKANAALKDARLAGDELVLSTVSLAEVYAGMYPEEADWTRRFLSAFKWNDVTPEVAELAGSYAFEYRQLRPKISLADYLIAATVRLLKATLWTLNNKDFPMFPGLKRPYS